MDVCRRNMEHFQVVSKLPDSAIDMITKYNRYICYRGEFTIFWGAKPSACSQIPCSIGMLCIHAFVLSSHAMRVHIRILTISVWPPHQQ